MKKMDDMDTILREALTFPQEPETELIHKTIQRIEEKNQMEKEKYKKKKISAAAVILPAAIALSSITAFASFRIMSAKEVAEEAGDEALAEAFEKQQNKTTKNANDIESQVCGGYIVRLLGIVSGKDISDFKHGSGITLSDESTYAVISIEHEDGTPMPPTQELRAGDFLISPYVSGLKPVICNIFTIGGGGSTAFSKDGIRYQITHVDNIDFLTDRVLYLGVTEGTFPKADAFLFDETSGLITRNPDYDGVNALFELPVDESKKNPEKTADFLSQFITDVPSQNQ